MTFPNRLNTWPTVLDLFAGPGGWDEGLTQLGIAARGIELDGDACDTGRAAGHYRHLGNVAAMNPRDVLGPWGQPEGHVASPPCQGFSTAGKGHGRRDRELLLTVLAAVDNLGELEEILGTLHRHMVDDRTLLALEPLRWALALGPRWLAWEQVPAVLPLWDACARVLRGIGYSVATGILRAEQHGVPQTRRRAFLVARDAATTAAHGPATLPAPTHSRYHEHKPERLDEGVLPWVSMAEALGWSPEDRVGFARRDDGREAVEVDGVRYRARDLHPASRPAPGLTEKVRSWSHIRMTAGHGAAPSDPESITAMHAAGVASVPGRPRTLDQPAATIAGKGTAAWGNGSGDGATVRRVTVAEAAVLQAFRADYPFTGSQTSRYRQVGNAVPPLLARRVVEAVRA